MNEEAVLYRREGNVGIITFNRPHRLNAITDEMLSNLLKRLNEVREDEKVVSAILTGAGRAFCAGEDIKETSQGKSFKQWVKEIDALQESQRLIMRLDKPLIAAINGYAVGGGLEFALSCDIRIAAKDAKMGFPETGLGLTVTNGGTKLISQLVGTAKAKELIFTGEFIDADEAFRIGLVNKVVPNDSLLDEALEMCRKIGQRSPLALKLSRIALDQSFHSSFEQILEIEAGHILTCVASQNYKEFIAKKVAEIEKK